MLREQAQPKIILRRMAVILLTGYWVLVVLFYFLAGEQLHLRKSRGNIDLLPAESGTVELAVGNVVEQRFTTTIHRLEQIDVQWGTYYRQNIGTVFVELWNVSQNSIIASQTYDAAAIQEGGVTTLTTEEPLEDLYGVPLMLRIYADSSLGNAVSPLMNQSTPAEEGLTLFLNGTPVAGTLCFSVSGEDYIWTGLHYWEFAVTGFGLLVLLLVVIWYRCKKGKRSYILNAVIAVQKYRFLIRQLVSRDFKTKYKRSVLGILWSFLNPLLTMCVQYFVFSTIFKNDIPHYTVYLLIGVVVFNFFTESCGMALGAIVGNASLITKVYVPKYIYPLTRVMSSVVNLAISILPLILVSFITGVHFHKSAILAVYFLCCAIIFSLGLGLFLSTAMVFFRDVQFLWGVLNMVWMYATPIFYPETILPDNFRFVLQINPLYHFLKNARICILNGISPEPLVYIQCMLIALVTLVIGAVVFQKGQDKFVLYL